MTFVVGFLVWTIFGVVAGIVVARMYKAAATEPLLTVIFGFFGAFIGGMLGSSAHVFHDATPLRLGGLLGALLGGVFFSFLYHYVARKAV